MLDEICFKIKLMFMLQSLLIQTFMCVIFLKNCNSKFISQACGHRGLLFVKAFANFLMLDVELFAISLFYRFKISTVFISAEPEYYGIHCLICLVVFQYNSSKSNVILLPKTEFSILKLQLGEKHTHTHRLHTVFLFECCYIRFRPECDIKVV